jgi:hypothetical protein
VEPSRGRGTLLEKSTGIAPVVLLAADVGCDLRRAAAAREHVIDRDLLANPVIIRVARLQVQRVSGRRRVASGTMSVLTALTSMSLKGVLAGQSCDGCAPACTTTSIAISWVRSDASIASRSRTSS